VSTFPVLSDPARATEPEARAATPASAGQLLATPAATDGRRSSWQAIRRAGAIAELGGVVLATLVALVLERDAGGHGRLLTTLYPFIVLAGLHLAEAPSWDHDTGLDGARRVATIATRTTLGLLGLSVLLQLRVDAAASVWQWGLTVALLSLARLVVIQRLRRLPRLGLRPTLIVGAGQSGRAVAAELLRDRSLGLDPVGFLDTDAWQEPILRPAEQAPSMPVLGSPAQLIEIAARVSAECVVLAAPTAEEHELLELLERSELCGLTCFVVPRLYEGTGWRMRVRAAGAVPVNEVIPFHARKPALAVKYGFDRAAAALLLLLGAPLMAVIAVLVKLTSRGPVLFPQRRVSRDGREFTMLKFRTMRLSPVPEASFVPVQGQAPGGIEGTDRRTRLGIWLRRSSLDELPQLLNVARGDMSLIGPRPERPEYAEIFGRTIARYDRRHRVKSGVTGLAQVSGSRGQGSLHERVAYDDAYIRNWSLWLDVKIVARTVKSVLSMEGE
jgi:exopolysaccharide biosynthesis polyprenyl glycosylphosphotransferase